LFRENNIEFERVNYFIEELTAEKIRGLLLKAGLKPFAALRKGEAAFKELNLSDQTPDDEIIAAMVKNPCLLQPPIVEAGERAVLARPIDKVKELLNLTMT